MRSWLTGISSTELIAGKETVIDDGIQRGRIPKWKRKGHKVTIITEDLYLRPLYMHDCQLLKKKPGPSTIFFLYTSIIIYNVLLLV